MSGSAEPWRAGDSLSNLSQVVRIGIALVVLAASVAGVVAPRVLDNGDTARNDDRAELPGGGTSVLPEHRVVAFYGAPQNRELGILGIGGPKQAGNRLERQAKRYGRGSRPVLPAFELISTIVLSAPGKDGKYRRRQPEKVISRYLEAARRVDGLLLLDLQPGRADFLSEAKALEPYLRRPDVGLALDPEWRMHGDEIPGQSIGHVGAGEVNQVTGFLSRLVEENNLPDKLVVIHQFTPQMIRERDKLRPAPGLDIVLNSDGFGAAADKREVYRKLAPQPGAPFFRGFKLFHAEDTGLMSSRQVLRLKPGPVDFVVYE